VEYIVLEIPRLGTNPVLAVDLSESVLACRDALAKALDGYRFGRRATIDPGDLSIDPASVELFDECNGMLQVKFNEAEFLACRYETATTAHEARLRFSLEAKMLHLKVLGSDREERMEGF